MLVLKKIFLFTKQAGYAITDALLYAPVKLTTVRRKKLTTDISGNFFKQYVTQKSR